MTTAYTINTNANYNSIEIIFDGKPSEEIRNSLKALRFRWHGVKKLWYGYSTIEAVKAAIEGKKATDSTETMNESTKATKAAEKATETKQNHIRIYWNGIKVDDGKLIKCGYSIRNYDGVENIMVFVRDYESLPKDLFEVKNDTDIYTDYFDSDRAEVTKDNPLYKYFFYCAKKADARSAKQYIDYLNKRRASNPDYYQKEIEIRRNTIKEFESMKDPGQPTQEDLDRINQKRNEEENARREAEHERKLEERERVLQFRHDGMEYIKQVMDQYPINEGEPTVLIPFSESPAFYNFMVEDSKVITINPDGTKTEKVVAEMPRCILSVKAADIVLKHFDEERHNRNVTEGRGGYDKTDFIITYTDKNGDESTYEGRYDLGDNEGGLINHIVAYGNWYLTHDQYGHEKETPEESNDTIKFAEYLKTFLG